jgi:hypothetical protein
MGIGIIQHKAPITTKNYSLASISYLTNESAWGSEYIWLAFKIWAVTMHGKYTESFVTSHIMYAVTAVETLQRYSETRL